VRLVADARTRCLAAVATSLAAEAGGRGGPQARAGRRGADCVVRVPVGTTVWLREGAMRTHGARARARALTRRADVDAGDSDEEEEEEEEEEVDPEPARGRRGRPLPPPPPPPPLRPASGSGPNFRPPMRLLADLKAEGEAVVVASGGRGGRGNGSTLEADKVGSQRDGAEAGGGGAVAPLLLELKSVADVGLVGPPNAGKSTLLAGLSNARPEIADYAFTTLRPQLGLVQSGFEPGPSPASPSVARQLLGALAARASLADIPGLVEGAHANRGLGHAFLRHVERCAALVLVVDLGAAGGADPGAPHATAARQLRMLRAELAAYSAPLAARPLLIVGSKADREGARRAMGGLRRAAAAARLPPPLAVSALTGEGMEELRAAVLALARDGRAAALADERRGRRL